MPVDDPTSELDEIVTAYLDGQLPEEAFSWANAARIEVDDTLEVIERMVVEDGKYDTPEQDEILELIYKEAWQWIILARRPKEGI